MFIESQTMRKFEKSGSLGSAFGEEIYRLRMAKYTILTNSGNRAVSPIHHPLCRLWRAMVSLNVTS